MLSILGKERHARWAQIVYYRVAEAAEDQIKEKDEQDEQRLLFKVEHGGHFAVSSFPFIKIETLATRTDG